MKINNFEKMKNISYSPKQALAYLIASSKNISNPTYDKCISSFESELLGNKNPIKEMEKVDILLIKEIKNYWILTIRQVVSYACIVFYNLQFENKQITEKSILDEFIYIMQIYSPDNAEAFVFNNKEKFIVEE